MRWIRSLFVAALLVVSLAPAAPGQQSVPLTVTRSIGEVSVGAGGSVSETVTLTNSSAQPMNVLAAVGDVAPSGNGFVLQTAGSTADSAAAWVTVSPSSVEVAAGSTTVVTVSVRAPAGVPVGEHAAGVLFSARRNAQALHTLIVTVIGEGLRRDAVVDSVRMPKFETRGRVPFRITVVNNGNTHAVVEGTISVRDRLRRSVTTITVPPLYAMPKRTSRFVLDWNDPPPILLARVQARLSVRYETPLGRSDVRTVSTTGISIAWWALALVVALLILVARLLVGLVARRRRKTRRARGDRRPEAQPTRGTDLPSPLAGSPQVRTGRSAWEGEPVHTSAAGALAVRRANAAIRLLRQGAGKSGVRPDVAVGLLRGVHDLPEVRREVEAAYDEAASRASVKEMAALSLALAVVESPRGPEALLRAYAKADRVLAARIRRALAQCDPADLRALPDLVDALPQTRRDVLPAR